MEQNKWILYKECISEIKKAINMIITTFVRENFALSQLMILHIATKWGIVLTWRVEAVSTYSNLLSLHFPVPTCSPELEIAWY